MEPGLKTGEKPSAGELFSFAFKFWLFNFIIILVPLDTLYRSGSLMKTFSPLQFAVNFSIVIIFFAILAAGIAIVSLGFEQLFKQIRMDITPFAIKVNVFFGLLFVIFVMSISYFRWLRSLLGYDIYIYSKPWLSLLLLSIFILIYIFIFIYKYNLVYTRITSLAKAFYKINVSIIILSIICCLVVAIFNYTTA